MDRLRRYIRSIILGLASICSACWFTINDSNSTYIVGVNNTIIHTTFGNGYVTFTNGQSVSIPITVQIKVGEINYKQNYKVILAQLQYKIIRNNSVVKDWTIVKTINNPPWALLFTMPVNLFGVNGSIDDSSLVVNDTILIRVYFMANDGLINGNLNEDIDPNSVNSTTIYDGDSVELPDGSGWLYPHVIKLIFNGKRGVSI